MRKWSHVLFYAPFVALMDVILIHLSFLTVFFVRWTCRGTAVPHFPGYVHASPYLAAGSIGVLHVCNLYVSWLQRRAKDVVYSLMVSALGITIYAMLLGLWEREFVVPQHVIITAGVLEFVFLAAYRRLLQRWYLAGVGRRRVIVIASDETEALDIGFKVRDCAPEWMPVVSYLLLHDLEKLEGMTRDYDAVLLAPSISEQTAIVRLCSRLKKQVMVIPAVLELSLFGARPLELNDLLILSIERPHLTPGARIVKRCVDLWVSAIALAVTGPFMAAIAIAIRKTSDGPAIFRQERLGRDGELYTLYKFRTMVCDAEKQTGPVLASESDERITSLGHWLRAMRLDELPQLLNVLKGDMSLVGPRPERAFFVEQFREMVAGYDLRFSVKPGITGLAQVAGGYATSVQRKLRFDLMYIFDYSLLLDVRILLRTVLVVFDKKQAQGIKAYDPAQPALAEDK